MTEVLFYHLTESTLDDALPGLLERSLERGWRAIVEVTSQERRDALDARLWTYSEESFLAHGTDAEDNAEHQPVLLTTGAANPNGAEVRFFVDGAAPLAVERYSRAVVMFDGHDQQQLEAARENWRAIKTEGHQATYWQQGEGGRWQKKS